jgi:non-canonical (house-cleaning) NTP pyrophosphatase
MNETILQAVRRAGRSANGDIAVMIAAGIEAGLAEKTDHKSHDVVTHLPCRWCRATVGHNVGCTAYGE